MSIISELINTGVDEHLEPFETRKTRLVNLFSLIGALLSIVFAIMNFLVGATTQGFLILSGLIVIAAPPLYLNHIKKRNSASFYLIAVALIFIDLITFRAVFNFQNRHNEVFLIGFSTIILVLLNNPLRLIFYSLTALSTIAMITARQLLAELPIGNDTYMAYLNVVLAYGFIYFFLDIFKKEQEKSVLILEAYNTKLEQQGKEIEKQRDDVFANRKLIRDTIDNLPVYIGLLDMKGRYLLANKLFSKTFRLPLEEIEGKHYSAVLSDSLKEKHTEIINQGLKGNSPEFSETIELPNGKIIHSMGKYVPLYDENENQFALAVYVADVTQLKHTEGELRSLNETKNRLLSIITHDIRGPLNSLKGLISLSDHISEQEFKKFIENVDKQLNTVNFNLDNVLNWAKTQMQGFKITRHKASVTDILLNTLKLFEPQLKEKGIKVNVNSEDKKHAFVDNNCLYLIFRNLISNAIKFSFPKSEIMIRLTEDGNNLLIDIIDSGTGIPAEKIEELEKGAQSVISEVGTIGESGTGLGLSLSFEMAKLNGGKLKIVPSPGGGTTARVSLLIKPDIGVS